MPASTAIIIGGGVIGLSTAYHLARKQFGRVIVLEKDVIGAGSSSRAAGIITGLLWSETGIRARQRSLQLFAELSRELAGYTFQAIGCLNLFDPPSWPERQQLLPLYERLGTPFEVLDAAAMRQRWPALQLPPEFIGLFDPRGGYSEPDQYVPALARRCQQLGVELREQERIDGFVTRQGRVQGVRSNGRDLESDVVICTTHAWTPLLAGLLNWRIPFKNFVHQRYLTRPLPAPVALPAINANPLGGYLRPAAGQRLLFGMETPDRAEWPVTAADFHMSNLRAEPGLPAALKDRFQPILAVLGETAWEDERVGLISFSMDGEPILGPVGRYPGLYVGCAFHSGGFAYNPVAGLLLAEFVANGSTQLDISAFSPDRFDPTQVESYLGSTVPQREALRRRH